MLFKSTLFSNITSENKGSLVFVYCLNFFETLCYLFIPAGAGFCIDGFIEHRFWGVWAFAATYLGWQGIAVLRRIYDTKLFSKIYNDISIKTIEHHKIEGIDDGKINARIELLKEVVTFFEDDFPFMLNSFVEMFGSAILLYFYNPKILLVCFVIIVPSLIINWFYSKKMTKVTTEVNNEYEKQYDIIAEKKGKDLYDYFNLVRRLNIRKSNLEAYNSGILELFVFSMMIVSLYIVTQTPNIKYGEIVATYGYISRFAWSFDFIPHLTGRYALLKDINKRLEDVY
jgi:ABC-type multidrug transport system fused ATPase/permease subunit